MQRITLSLLIFMVGCTASVPPTPSATPPLRPRPPATEHARELETPVLSPTTPPSTPTDHAPYCAESNGKILDGVIEDDGRMGRELEYQVYLPPCYREGSGSNYPVLYLLHGLQQSNAVWGEIGLQEIADELFTNQGVSPFIIVMPWEKTGLDIGIALTDVLIPYIDDAFDTCPKRNCRAVGGISRGGGWALHIGIQHPGLFNSIGLHSPATFDHDVYLARWVQEANPADLPSIWVDIGDRDTLRPDAKNIVETLQNLGLEVDSSTRAGYHDRDYWETNLQEYLEWYAGRFER